MTGVAIAERKVPRHVGGERVVNNLADPVYTVPDPCGHDIKLNSFYCIDECSF